MPDFTIKKCDYDSCRKVLETFKAACLTPQKVTIYPDMLSTDIPSATLIDEVLERLEMLSRSRVVIRRY